MSTAEYISTKDVATIIRQELARAFHGTKFSVITQSYSGGSHVDVRWTDGPSTRQVDQVIGRFGGRTFDGMDDSTHFHDSEWQGRRVHFSGSAPSTQRHITNFEALKEQALTMIRARCHLDETGERFGNDRIDNLASGMVWACDFREAVPLDRAFRLVVFRESEA